MYTADMLWMISRRLCGADFAVRPYSEMVTKSVESADVRTEAEITQDIIARLRGEK